MVENNSPRYPSHHKSNVIKSRKSKQFYKGKLIGYEYIATCVVCENPISWETDIAGKVTRKPDH